MSANNGFRLGVWASWSFAAVGVAYSALLGKMMLAELPFPPTGFYATGFNWLNLVAAALVVPMWCAIHQAVPVAKRTYTLTALAFATMFATVVMINRFIAMTVVRHDGAAVDLDRFTPYGEFSVMRAFEMLGFGVFYSLACLLLMPVFVGGLRERAIATLLGVCGVFGLVGAVGFALESTDTLGLVAPVAWGLGPVAAACLIASWLGSRSAAPQALLE